MGDDGRPGWIARHWLAAVSVVTLLVGAGAMTYDYLARQGGAERGADLAPARGEALFAERCALCHGREATGTGQGPPLVHAIYRPSHHPDASFLAAVRNGVRAHHWRFGDMPPLEGLGDEDVGAIVDYVRHLQRRAGIE